MFKKFNNFFKKRKNKLKKTSAYKKLESKKPINKSNKAKFKDVYFEGSLEKGLAYTKKAKELLKESPGLLNDFLKLTNSKKPKLEKSFINKKGKRVYYSIIKEDLKKGSYNTESSYLINLKINKIDFKFYVKKSFGINSRKFKSFLEMKGVQILKDYGFDVIPAQFSFYSKSSRASYIAYNYIDHMYSLKNAYKKKLLDYSEIIRINNKLKSMQKEINNYLKKNYKRYNLPKDIMIKDIAPENPKKMTEANVFYDPKTEKIFLFDPWVISESNFYSGYK